MAQLYLLLISFLTLIIPHLFISGILSSTTFTVVNNCNYTVWPGISSGTGSAQLPTTGFALQKNESRTINAPSSWIGSFWGRTHCTVNSTGKFSCLTGDCGSGKIECAGSFAVRPVTLADFNLNGFEGGNDYNPILVDGYDVSLVDGYNLPMLIVPQGGTGLSCTNAGCISDLNKACPSELKVMSKGGEGVACKSACEAFGTAQFCCSGVYNTPDACKPTSYSEYFKKACPRARNYPDVDETNTFRCAGADYLITFCPSATDETNNGTAIDGPYSPTDPIFLDCGSKSEKISVDGREWVGDASSIFTQSSMNTSISFASNASEKDPSVTQVPYMTARIFRDSPFTYTFPLSAGPKFVRLYFYPATYSGLDKSKSFFSVKSGGYTLLRNFSASLTVAVLEPPVSFFVKEFILHVSDNILNLTFSAISPESYGFVNGIEIVSIPENLYILGNSNPIPLIGQNTDYFIFNDTAFETLYRLNIGGNNVPVALDTGMFRSWFNDDDYIKSEDHGYKLDRVFSINYTLDTPPYTAPETVYSTSKTSIHNLTWHFTVDDGFNYLLRLHFCEFQLEVTRINQRVFSIFINDQIAEEDADVMAWTGGNGIPVFKDYIVLVSNPYDGLSKQKLWLTMDPRSLKHAPNSSDVILNGLEIFKLSGSDSSLAGRNPEVYLTPPSQRKRKTKWLLKFGVVLGGGIAALSILSYLVFRRWRKASLTDTKLDPIRPTKLSASFLLSDIRHFSLAEIKSSTSNFNDNLVIGVGGFGNVYKGCIDNGAITVAIKRLNASSHQGIREFETEIEMLSKLRHLHLVSLIGYCKDNGEMVLVYDYMANGTLRAHLCKPNNPLSWKHRLQICIGSARGLQYLHTSSKQKIIHRDVKSTNILLDERWVAKVSDFGLSKIGPTGVSHTHVSTLVKGSFGYLDPEYYRLQRLTDKSDVYSFGVVLFEVLSGKPAIILDIPEEPLNLAEWARCCYKTGALDEIIDLHVRDEIAPECLKKFADVAYSCVQEQGINRPSMNDVVWSLELALQLQEAAENMSANGAALETLENFMNLPFHLREDASTEHIESLSGSIKLAGSSGSNMSLSSNN